MAKKSNPKKAKLNEVAQSIVTSNVKLLGEIITWTPSEHGQNYKDVVSALQSSGLEHEVAKELLPRNAFSRASRKLAEDRVVDVLREESGSITFQFTKKQIENNEWKFTKDCLLVLDKDTGKITCDDKKLEQHATMLLAQCMEIRTSNDVTKIVQRLFDLNADMFPIRDQGGAYFVPAMYSDFVNRVETFLTTLGGRIGRFPIPAETRTGDKSVQDTVAHGMATIIAEHEDAVAEFGLDTRQTTIQAMAMKIKATRTKLEAYANYLLDRKGDLEKAIEEANQKLTARIAKISQERAEAPAVSANGRTSKSLVFGYAPTAVLRWMGRERWSYAESYAAFCGLQLEEMPAEATFRAQLQAGKLGQRGDPANLTKEQIKELDVAKIKGKKILDEEKKREEQALKLAMKKKGGE